MSNPAFRPEDRQRFALRVQTPVRAYAVASICSLAGALLIVNWLVRGWPTLVGVLAIALLVFGIALNVAALVLKRRYQTTILIERDIVGTTAQLGVEMVVSGETVKSGLWVPLIRGDEMKLPSGRLGSCRPARARRIAFETAMIASSCPITRWCSRSSM